MTDAPRNLHPDRYQAYLVRLWQEGAQGPWRALAKDTRTGEIARPSDNIKARSTSKWRKGKLGALSMIREHGQHEGHY